MVKLSKEYQPQLNEKMSEWLAAGERIVPYAIRMYLTESMLLNAGHIGDGVRPSQRRKGVATKMIGLALVVFWKMRLRLIVLSSRGIG